MFNFCAFLALVVIDQGWLALTFVPMTALGAVVTPAIQGQMSRAAGDDQQGELQGVVASTRSVAQIISPLVMTQLFWVFTAPSGLWFPGAPFALSALIMVCCLTIFIGRSRDVTA